MGSKELVMPDGVGFGNEALKNYDVGTWVPALVNGGTLTVSGAKYVRVGNLVNYTVYLTSIAVTNNGSQMWITLPFTSASDAGIYCGGVIAYSATTPMTEYRPLVGPNSGYLYFENVSGLDTLLNSTYFAKSGTKTLIITGTYFV